MKKQLGFSLLEVMIALVILASGILGAVAMQAMAKKGSFDSMQRSLASAIAQDIIERMRSNQSITTILESYEGTYGLAEFTAPVPRCNTQASICTAAQMVRNDLYEWQQILTGADVTSGSDNVGGLVGAIGCITHANNAVTVVISWQGRTEFVDSATANCGTGSNKRRQIVVSAFIY